VFRVLTSMMTFVIAGLTVSRCLDKILHQATYSAL